MKRVIIICIFINFLYSQMTFSLSPQLVELEIPPGGRGSFTISYWNESDTATATIKVFISDITETDAGTYKVLNSDTSRWSCAKWIEVSPDSFTLKPRSAQEVLCNIKVPRDARGGRYAAIVFELLPKKKKEKKIFAFAEYYFRAPSFVELKIKGRRVKKRAIISDFQVISASEIPRYSSRYGKNALIFSASLKNESEIHIFGKGRLKIRDKNKRIVRDVPLGGGRGLVLPECIVKFESILAPLPPGEYTAEAVIDYGSPSPAIARIPFQVQRRKVTLAGGVETITPLNIELKPQNIQMMAPSGAFRTFSFIFKNYEDIPLHVSVLPRAMTFDIDGDIILLDTSDCKWCCTEWVKIEPSSFTVRPRGVQRVKATINVPDGVSGERYACIVYKVMPNDTMINTTDELALSLRSTISLTIPGEVEKNGEIEKMKVEAYPNTPLSLTLYFKNTGNVHLNPSGKATLEIFKTPEEIAGIKYIPTQKYEKIEEVVIKRIEKSIFPGSKRRIKVNFPSKLKRGKYRVTVKLDYGGIEPAEVVKEFTIK